MNISKMDKRITIQSYENVIDDDGFASQEWTDFYSCWANISNVSGNEFWAAMANNAEKTIIFEVRYSNKTKEIAPIDYRILYKNKSYKITFVDEHNKKDNTIKIKGEAING